MGDQKRPKVIITGASGFIGTYAVKYFIRHHWEVFAVIRPSKKGFFKEEKSEYFHEILCDLEDDYFGKMNGRFDVFLHLAWKGLGRDAIDNDSVQELNKDVSLRCAEAALRFGCKVYIDGGSRAEYGNPTGKMYEKTECCPITSYGRKKLEVYNQTQSLFIDKRINYCHLRIFSVYGKGDHSWSLISTLIRDLAEGKTVTLSPCLHYWNFMYIEDAVAAIYQLAVREMRDLLPKTEVVNIASKDTRYLYEYVHAVHQLVGGKGEIVFGAFSQGKEKGLSIVPDTTHLYELIPEYQEEYTFEEGIRLFLNS